MAWPELILQITGKLKDDFLRLNAYFSAAKTAFDAHTAGTADKHLASNVTNNSTESGVTVKDALDNSKNKIDNHITGIANKHSAQNINYAGEAAGSDVKSAIDGLQADINNLSFTGSEHDALVTSALVDADGEDFAAAGTYLSGRLDKWENKAIVNLDDNVNSINSKNNFYYPDALVSFVFDDGKLEDYTRFKPIFESEGVPGCANVITSYVGVDSDFMTMAQLKELKNLGWTVCSHTHTHTSVLTMTEEQIDYEYKTSHDILLRNGLDHDIIVYPYGATSELARSVARRYYKMGVNIVRSYLSNKIPDIDNMNMTRIPGLSQAVGGVYPTLAECKAAVDSAIANKDYIIFEDHSHYDVYDAAKLDELRQLIQYIKSKGVPIVNLQDGYKMKCNILDVGERTEAHFKLHRDGKISDSNTGFIVLGNDAYSISDSIDDYPAEKITVWRINTDLSSVPLASSGLIMVYKLGIYPNMWYREYRTINRVYWSYWDSVTSTWGSWISYGERLTDTYIVDLPTAAVSHLGRMLLVKDAITHNRDVAVCTRLDDGSYVWKKVQLIDM